MNIATRHRKCSRWFTGKRKVDPARRLHIKAIYTREKKPRLTLAAAYIRRENPV